MHGPRSLTVPTLFSSVQLVSPGILRRPGLALGDSAYIEQADTHTPFHMTCRKANFCRIGRPVHSAFHRRVPCPTVPLERNTFAPTSRLKRSVLFFVLLWRPPQKAYLPSFPIDGSASPLPAASHYFFVGSPTGSTPDPSSTWIASSQFTANLSKPRD